MNHGRLLLRLRPSRNSIKAGTCIGNPGSALAPDVRHFDRRQPRGVRRANLGVVVRPLAPDGGNRAVDVRIAGASADEAAKVVAIAREETGVKAPIGGQACTRAIAAESVRDRRDDTDFAAAVAVAPPLRNLP